MIAAADLSAAAARQDAVRDRSARDAGLGFARSLDAARSLDETQGSDQSRSRDEMSSRDEARG